jgi:hypothetical protein
MGQGIKGVLLAGLMFGPVFAVAQSNMTGTWDVSGTAGGNKVVSTCVMQMAQDGKVTGTCTGMDGKAMPVKGMMSAEAVSWSYASVHKGDKIVLNYVGMVNVDGSVIGTITIDPFNAQGNFIARLQPIPGAIPN